MTRKAWLPVDQLPEDQPFLMEVIYEEAIYSDSQGALRFPFYQATPSQGNIEIDKRYRHTDNSASLPLTLPSA